MFEVYYKEPPDPGRESGTTARVAAYGGRLGYKEADAAGPVCLTYEFPSIDSARVAASALRGEGEHVEGPADYGPD